MSLPPAIVTTLVAMANSSYVPSSSSAESANQTANQAKEGIDTTDYASPPSRRSSCLIKVKNEVATGRFTALEMSDPSTGVASISAELRSAALAKAAASLPFRMSPELSEFLATAFSLPSDAPADLAADDTAADSEVDAGDITSACE
jgi:hypothetical protein